jgi:transposase InsO family protein
MPHLKLLYFDIHGLAARVRHACAVSGLPLEDVRLPRAAFDARRGVVYVTDSSNHMIHALNLSSGVLARVASSEV